MDISRTAAKDASLVSVGPWRAMVKSWLTVRRAVLVPSRGQGL